MIFCQDKAPQQKLDWHIDMDTAIWAELHCDSPPQCQSWFGSHGVRYTLCILAGLCPCRCWHTETTCWSCWRWWGRFHNHTERSARRPFSSGQTSSSWKSPIKTKIRVDFVTTLCAWISLQHAKKQQLANQVHHTSQICSKIWLLTFEEVV